MAKKVQNKKNTAGAVANRTPNKPAQAKGGKPAAKPAPPAKKQQQQKPAQKKQQPAKKEVPAKKVEEEKKVLQEADDDSSSGEMITEEQFNEMLKSGEITEADLAALEGEGSDEEIELTEEQIQEMIKNGEITLEDLENAAAAESDSDDSEDAEKVEKEETKDVEMTEAAAPAPAAAPVAENKNSKKRKADAVEDVAATETPVANSPKKQKTSNNAVMFHFVDFGTRPEEFKSFVSEKCGAIREVALAGYNARVVFEDEKSVGKALALNKVEFRSKQLRVFNLDKAAPTTTLKAYCKIEDFSDDEVTKFFSTLSGVESVEVRPTGGVYNVANLVMKSLEASMELAKKIDVTFKGVPVFFDFKFAEKDIKKGARKVGKKADKKIAA